MAKTLQKYILALAQQVAIDQGRPLVISTLVARLHRRLQNVKEADGAKNDPKEEAHEDSEEETPLVIHDSSSDEEMDKGHKRLTRSQKKRVSTTDLMCT